MWRAISARPSLEDALASAVRDLGADGTSEGVLANGARWWREAGGLLRTTTGSTLNPLLEPLLLRTSVWAFAMKVSHGPISFECLFSMTIMRGGQAGDGGREGDDVDLHPRRLRRRRRGVGGEVLGRAWRILLASSSNHFIPQSLDKRARERRFRVCKEAPGFRLGPRTLVS